MVSFVNDSNGNTPLYYIPVTLTNNQSSSTPSNQEVYVSINSNTNSSKYGSTLRNVNWQDGAGNILKSWLESGETNSSTSSVYWINLAGNTIAGSGGTFIVYQVLYSTSAVSMDTSVTGAEPNYTGTYAQFDTGSGVFHVYDNFAGTSLSSLWNHANDTTTVNNGLKTTASSTGTWGGISLKTSYSQTTYTEDALGHVNGYNGGGGPRTIWGWNDVGAENNTLGYGDVSSTGGLCNRSGGSTNQVTVSGLSTTSNQIITVCGLSSSSSMQVNYGTAVTNSTYYNTSTTKYNSFYRYDSVETITVQWFRLRLTPPSNVLPSQSTGSITPISTSTVRELMLLGVGT